MPLVEILFKPAHVHLHGATLGEHHFSQLMDKVEGSTGDVSLIVDLGDVVSITASYLKATLLRLLKTRRGEMPQAGDAGLSAPTGFHLFTFVTGCSPDVAVDIHEFFVGRNLPLIHLDHWEKNRLIDGRLMGTLDPVLFRTLEGVIRLKECTASRLVEISSETITVNGWSNRLADLYQFSLVTRRRDSKFWIYSSVIERITLWV